MDKVEYAYSLYLEGCGGRITGAQELKTRLENSKISCLKDK